MPLNRELSRKIGEEILQWWYRNKRDYPWRHEGDPYKILIAEIMLQRTKAEQVVPVYVEFINKYPTMQDLAKANLEDVEKYFARLGLRWRAKKVLAMARYVAEKFQGKLPETEKDLLEIPAVGEYIADALAVFAYGRDKVVVDANVVRIIERLFCVKSRGEGRRDPKIRQLANSMLVPGKSREFNWALIDFGALVCRPAHPLCRSCPLSSLCCYGGTAK
jgi:A/G-specific adenine glycosylase